MKNKRLKSGAITFTAFAAVVAAVTATPAWDTFVAWVTGQADVAWGIPVAIIGLVTVIIDNIWKQVLNNNMADKSEFPDVASASAHGVDTY